MDAQNQDDRSFRTNITKGAIFSFALRVPRTVAAVRAAVTVWLIALGAFFIAHGYPWGALLFIAAAVHLALAFRLVQTSRAGRR